ncbi:MAG: hypothetical protein NTY08_14765 [Proteobacteria bacterium]|nr:hypothetical protein [Pseudomonadota bacterium]
MSKHLLYFGLLLASCGRHGETPQMAAEPSVGAVAAAPTLPVNAVAPISEATASAQENFGNSSFAIAAASSARLGQRIPNMTPFPNSRGYAATYSTKGFIDLENAFFKSFGTNGRTCATCHSPSTGWTVNPADIQSRFLRTNGLDPIFRTNDGSNCAKADVSTPAARWRSYSLLLSKGLFRVEMPIPTDGEFELVAATGVYCNNPMANSVLQLFRRPLPSTNLKFTAAVMWDGRESAPGLTVAQALSKQANDAMVGHAQALSQLPQATRDEIVEFETSLFTAQVSSLANLVADGARGGPQVMATLPFSIGINDTPINPVVFDIFDAWKTRARSAGQAAIARGQTVFNTKKFRIVGVSGQDSQDFVGSCATCHNTPNVGSYSVPEFFNIGIGSATSRTLDMPLYTVKNKVTGATVAVSDLGRAMVTGKWEDIGRFKPSNLRAVATRAPYFHDGSATSLEDVVGFYSKRFNIGFTPMERADLVAFLRSL